MKLILLAICLCLLKTQVALIVECVFIKLRTNEQILSDEFLNGPPKSKIKRAAIKEYLRGNGAPRRDWSYKMGIWNPDEPIEYSFDGSSTYKDRELVHLAVEYLRNFTCLDFKYVDDNHFENRIVFRKIKDSRCYSDLGRQSTYGAVNYITLSPACFKVGDIVHELGHALGLIHEHQRPDRDDHVEILWGNIDKIFHPQYIKFQQLYFRIYHFSTLGLPYDYGSIMHYGSIPLIFDTGKEWNLTMIPTKLAYMLTIGSHHELSFYDLKGLNIVYCPVNLFLLEYTQIHMNCVPCKANFQTHDRFNSTREMSVSRRIYPVGSAIQTLDILQNLDRCANKSLKCERGGFLHPRNCSQCICPHGLTGISCNEVSPYEGQECGGLVHLPQRETITIKTPSWPPFSSLSRGQSCTWLLIAPVGRILEFKIRSGPGILYGIEKVLGFAHWSFNIAKQYAACLDYVEVKNSTDFGNTGMRFCSSTPPKGPIYSESREMLVLFRSNHETSSGFGAYVRALEEHEKSNEELSWLW